MTYEQFLTSIEQIDPPEGINDLIRALWLEKAGKWDEAHTLAQGIGSAEGSAVHAYLHRVEGDLGNAGYWYNRAGREPYAGTKGEEWDSLVNEFL
jgi:hypothetical protein